MSAAMDDSVMIPMDAESDEELTARMLEMVREGLVDVVGVNGRGGFIYVLTEKGDALARQLREDD